MTFATLKLTTALLLAIGTTGTAAAETTDFSNGPEGWVGNAEIDPTLGNGAPAFRSLVESFGLSWRNNSNSAFTGDFTTSPGVTISLDVLTNSITYLGREVSRGMFVKLQDFGPDGEDAPPAATLYYRLGTVAASIEGWQRLSVTIDDTSVTGLPSGWGAVDADGVLGMPAGRSFADILANVDQIEFTTFEPDFFYGFTTFDVAGDNFTVNRAAAAVPEAATWAMMIVGVGAVGTAARRRRRVAVAFAA